jgi:chitinase
MLVDYVAVYQSGTGSTTPPTTAPTTAPTTTPPASGCTGLPTWAASTVYTGGNAVAYNSRKYTAKWWTQGDQPDQNTGDGKPWTDNGACTGGGTTTPTTAPTTAPTTNPPTTPPAGSTTWAAYTAYTVGQLVTYAGVSYRCLQSHTSLPGWEPPNVGALWQRI